MKSKRNCIICNRVFYAENSEINRGRGLTCSPPCRYKHHSQLMTGRKMKPEAKRKLIEVLTGRVRSKIHNANISKGLKGKYRGSKNGNWRGGKYLSKNRWFIRCNSHPRKHRNGYVFYARYIAEKVIGRYLSLKEEVHHLNLKSNDDRSENLYIFSTGSNHTSYHQLLKAGKTKLITESNLSNY